MAGGKETPRQKMIGMMYLVLTALLAMNISKDVLNAFIQINRGMVKNAANAEQRADATMLLLDSWSDATKAAPFQTEAHKFVDESDALIKYIIELKARVLSASINGNADGAGFETFLENGHLIDIGDKEKVSKPDENQNTTAMLIGSEPANPIETPWSAVELRKKLSAFSERAAAVEVTDVKGKVHKLAENSPETMNLIKSTFVFEDLSVPGEDQKEKWETALFYHTPVAAVISHLSKLENDVILVKNAVLNYLTSQINSSDLKFSDVTVAVVPKQSYIMRGDSFVAEIYLAAYNKNSSTRVYMSSGEAGENAKPELFDYSGMTPITSGSDGKCKFKINQSALGSHSHKGVIVYQDADGADKAIPFIVPAYTVGEASCVISPMNMMVLYKGIDNPIEVSVPGVDAGGLSVNINNGSLSKSGSFYNAVPSSEGKATVSVTATLNGRQFSAGTKEFEVKRLPSPMPKLGGKFGPSVASLSKNDIMANAFVTCDYPPEFPVGKGLAVTLGSCDISINGGLSINCPGGRIPQSALSQINALKPGQVVVISGIDARVNGQMVGSSSSLAFKIK